MASVPDKPASEGAGSPDDSPRVPWFMASRPRLFGTLFLAFALPAGSLGLLAADRARRTLRDQAMTQNSAAAALAAQLVGEHFGGLSRFVELTAGGREFRDASARKAAGEVGDHLRDLVEIHPDIDRAFITDVRGVEWVDYPHDPAAIGLDLSGRDWFKGVSGRGGTYVSSIYRRRGGTRIVSVAIATPIRDAGGSTVGYLVAHHPIRSMAGWVTQIRPSEAGSVVLVDHRGTVAREPKPGEDSPTNLGRDPLVREVLAGGSGSKEAADPVDGAPSLVSFAPVRSTGWGVLARQPVGAVFAPVEALRRSVWVMALACLAPVLILGALWLRSIRRFHRALGDRNDRLARALGELRASHRATEIALADLKSAQGRMLQQAKMASLGQTAAGVAHEINNPLAFVTNNIAVLKREVTSLHEIFLLYRRAEDTLALNRGELLGQIQDMSNAVDLPYLLKNLDNLMDRSREGLRRIQKIVEDLRDFAHLEEADRKEVDLNNGIVAIVGLMQGLALKNRVTLTTDLAPTLRLFCYPAKLNLVVQNLLSNAIDACRPDDRIVVRTRRLDDAVEVEVEDTGLGVDPAIRDKVFDPFFTTKPIGKGTGLGLSMCYGVVKEHGGTIDFESPPGQGTRFVVHLPLDPQGDCAGAPGKAAVVKI